jgi:hypothetical protein
VCLLIVILGALASWLGMSRLTVMFFAGFFWGVVVARLDDIFRWWSKRSGGNGDSVGTRDSY